MKQSPKKSPSKKTSTSGLPFKVGDAVLIRTVTMIQLGRLTAIGPDYFVLTDGGWVGDTGRFNECLSRGTLSEFERAPSWIFVGRGSVVDIFPWVHDMPQISK